MFLFSCSHYLTKISIKYRYYFFHVQIYELIVLQNQDQIIVPNIYLIYEIKLFFSTIFIQLGIFQATNLRNYLKTFLEMTIVQNICKSQEHKLLQSIYRLYFYFLTCLFLTLLLMLRNIQQNHLKQIATTIMKNLQELKNL